MSVTGLVCSLEMGGRNIPKGTFCLEGAGFLEDFFRLPIAVSTRLNSVDEEESV